MLAFAPAVSAAPSFPFTSAPLSSPLSGSWLQVLSPEASLAAGTAPLSSWSLQCLLAYNPCFPHRPRWHPGKTAPLIPKESRSWDMCAADPRPAQSQTGASSCLQPLGHGCPELSRLE